MEKNINYCNKILGHYKNKKIINKDEYTYINVYE